MVRVGESISIQRRVAGAIPISVRNGVCNPPDNPEPKLCFQEDMYTICVFPLVQATKVHAMEKSRLIVQWLTCRYVPSPSIMVPDECDPLGGMSCTHGTCVIRRFREDLHLGCCHSFWSSEYAWRVRLGLPVQSATLLHPSAPSRISKEREAR